jgi:hypothetical protein
MTKAFGGRRLSIVNGSALDCGWSNRVRARPAIALFEFLAGAEGFDVGHAVDGEDAVEVVDLVLEEFGEIAFIAGAEFLMLTREVPIAYGDPAVPFDLHEYRQEAQTRVPDNNLLFAAFDDFGIHQRPGRLSGQLQEDDTLAHPELRSCDAAAVTGGRAPVGKRIGEVLYQGSNFGCRGILDRQPDLAQSRIAKLEDGADGHSLWSAQLPVLSSDLLSMFRQTLSEKPVRSGQITTKQGARVRQHVGRML